MKLEINDKMKMEIDLYDIIKEVVANTPEDRMWEIIESFMWEKPILKMCSEALANEFSRPNYNCNIHEERELFLKHIKQEEIKFYASKIADHYDDMRRHTNSFWKLYNWCREKNVFNDYPDHPAWDELPERYDPEWRTELEKICEQAFLNKFPELKEKPVSKDGGEIDGRSL